MIDGIEPSVFHFQGAVSKPNAQGTKVIGQRESGDGWT